MTSTLTMIKGSKLWWQGSFALLRCFLFGKCCSFSCIFYNFLKIWIWFSDKITQQSTQQNFTIWDSFFWQFCTPSGHICGCGKLRNHQKITLGGLCRWAKKFFLKPGFWQFSIFTKWSCCKSPKWPYRPKYPKNEWESFLLGQDTPWVL